MNRKIAILFALVLFCVASAGCAQKTAQEDTPIVTEMTFDIDGDGEEEACVIDTGPTSGIMSFLLSATTENTLKYCSMLTVIPDGTPTFVKVGKETRLRLLPLSEEKSVDFSFSRERGACSHPVRRKRRLLAAAGGSSPVGAFLHQRAPCRDPFRSDAAEDQK